ncbi:hypothetical protein HK100_007127, partial [Physocladia obscura]
MSQISKTLSLPIDEHNPTVSPSSKSICRLFYNNAPHDVLSNSWKCKCGVEHKCDVIKSSYNNLMTHIKSKHSNHLNIYTAYALESFSTSGGKSNSSNQFAQTLNYMIDVKSRNIYKWLDWIVKLSFCKKECMRENLNLQKIYTKTLKKYIFQLVDAVEKKITTLATAAPCYALVFDSWTQDSTHFIGKKNGAILIINPGITSSLFITLPAKNTAASSPNIYLLVFAPLLDKTTLTAANHWEFILAKLEWNHLPADNLVCLISDNCNTNDATANLLLLNPAPADSVQIVTLG